MIIIYSELKKGEKKHVSGGNTFGEYRNFKLAPRTSKTVVLAKPVINSLLTRSLPLNHHNTFPRAN